MLHSWTNGGGVQAPSQFSRMVCSASTSRLDSQPGTPLQSERVVTLNKPNGMCCLHEPNLRNVDFGGQSRARNF